MRYALLIYLKPGQAESMDPETAASVHEEYMAISRLPEILGGDHLGPIEAATTVRVEGSETLITDGPFADTKEIFGGYYLMEADDIDAALAIAARVPAARSGGCVEVRPLVEYES